MRAPSGIGTQNVVKQRFCHFTTLQQGIGPLPYTVFRANSVYDPDFTGVGGSAAMGFDQMASFYERYVVLGSKITVQVATESAGNGFNYMCGVYLEDNSTFPYSSWEGLREAKKGQSKLICHQRNGQWLTAKYSAKKFHQVKDVKDVSNLSGTVAGNPDESAFFIVWMQPLDKSTEQTVELCVTIDYIVQYSEPKEIARS